MLVEAMNKETVKESDIQKILSLGRDRKLSCFFPGRPQHNPVYHNIQLQLAGIKKREEDPTPRILWNLRPWDNFNIIHAIYTQKLKQFQEAGFNIQIIFFDKLVEKIEGLRDKVRLNELRINIRDNVKWIINSGLNVGSTEFLLESFLWEAIKFSDFSNKITSFGQICEFGTADLKLSQVLDNLWEIYYEDMVNCDFLLTGAKDQDEIWGMLRENALEDQDFDYNPPTILSMPQITGINGREVTPKDCNNLLTINDSQKEIHQKLSDADEAFIRDVVELFLLPHISHRITHLDIDESCYSYPKLKELFSAKEKLLDYCTMIVDGYFQKIKN